jgi:hypothetical protein
MAIVVGPGIQIGGGITVEAGAPDPVTTGLQVYFDAGNAASYPGSGTTWTSLVNGYTGTLQAGVGYSASNGGVLTFNGGSSATVNMVNSTFAALTNNFSVEFWYSSTNNRPGLVANGSGSNGFVFGYYSVSGTNFKVTKYGVFDIDAGTIPQNTAWHQAVLTYSSTTGTRVYVDGALSSPTSANTTNLSVGSSTFNIGRSEGNYHNGSIGIVRMYNTVLSATDVSQNFSAFRGRYGI